MQKHTAASFLMNHAHYPWRNKPFSLSNRQPTSRNSRRKFQRSTADDIHSAKQAWEEHQKQKASSQNGDVAPGAADEASQQQLEDIAQEVFKELAPETTFDTSMHIGYDELMDIDHQPAVSNETAFHDIPAKSANDAKEPAQSQSQDPVKAPQPALDWTDPQALQKHGTLLQKALAYLFTCIASVVGLFVAWQVAKFVARCVVSLAHIHTWLMIMGLAVIALITPQASKINGLLRFVDDFNLFANYGQAKHAISVVTWSSIACFLVMVFFAGSI